MYIPAGGEGFRVADPFPEMD